MQLGLADILGFYAFGLGACIASFLNVVIWRVPRGESIISPPSHCPKCNAPIRWYQNLPIVSYLALRGKCANCRASISPRYLIVEFIGGLLFFAAYRHCLVNATGHIEAALPALFYLLVLWVWLSLMIVGSAIDFDLKLLPDFVTVGGMVLGLLYYGLNSLVFRTPVDILFSAGGLAFGFGLFLLIRLVGSKIFKREAMGMGDVFLMGAVGAISGPLGVLFTLIFSSVFGSLFGLSLIALSKTKFGKFVEIPYGPYICAAHLLYLFYGAEIVNWYLVWSR